MFFFGESHKESKYLVTTPSILPVAGALLNGKCIVVMVLGRYDGCSKVGTCYDNDSKPYDSIHNGDPSVVYKDGNYYMVFSSVGFDNRDGITYIVNCVMGPYQKMVSTGQKLKPNTYMGQGI